MIGEATTRFENRHTVVLFRKPQSGHRAAEAGPDDCDIGIEDHRVTQRRRHQPSYFSPRFFIKAIAWARVSPHCSSDHPKGGSKLSTRWVAIVCDSVYFRKPSSP